MNTTLVCAVNAAGFFVPPMIIFKRKRMQQELEIGAPAGSIVTISDTGYINSDLFVSWLKHFKKHVNCSKDSPVLLLLDGHATHSKNLEAVEYARENGIVMLQLPGHTTHRLQPLDVAFFAPLQTYFNQAQDKWLRHNVGKTITQLQIAGLLNEAYGRAASVGTAESAFRGAGIWPVNRNVFCDHHFAPSDSLTVEKIADEPSSEESSSDDDIGKGKSFRKALNEISPLPKVSRVGVPFIRGNVRRGRKTQGAVVITSSPYKQELERAKGRPQLKKLKTVSLFKEHEEHKDNSEDCANWFCILCEEVKEEDMIQCMGCKSWVHTRCAKVRPSIKRYYCTDCK